MSGPNPQAIRLLYRRWLLAKEAEGAAEDAMLEIHFDAVDAGFDTKAMYQAFHVIRARSAERLETAQ